MDSLVGSLIALTLPLTPVITAMQVKVSHVFHMRLLDTKLLD